MSSSKKDNSGSFYEFQELCIKLGSESSHLKKTQLVKNYLETFKGDIYLFLKLLITKSDQRVFNLQKKKLCKIFAEIFQQEPEEILEELKQEEGVDIGLVLKRFYKKTNLFVSRSTLTLKEVDVFLDKLTTLTKEKEQIEAMEDFFPRKTTPNDLCYVVRLIVGDLRTYAGARYILSALHEDAYDLFTSCNNLRTVVDRVLNPHLEKPKQVSGEEVSHSRSAEVHTSSFTAADLEAVLAKPDLVSSDPSEDEEDFKSTVNDGLRSNNVKEKLRAEILIGSPVKPMLAKSAESFQTIIDENPNGFIVETKYDGERIQIHKDGSNFKYFSRAMKPMKEDKYGNVEEYIKKAVKAEKAILDGEILLLDIGTGIPLPFGTLGKLKKKQITNACVCVFVFDILLLDGKQLINIPLESRRKVLEKVVKPIPNRFLLSEKTFVDMSSPEEAIGILQEKIEYAKANKLEGIVVKNIKGIYEPNARHWIKVKPENVGMADSVDLLVLGAYFGTGSKSGKLSVFLMGVYDEQDKLYKTCCKCGNGFTEQEIESLQGPYRQMMTQIHQDPYKVPTWLVVENPLVPDFVIKDPKKTDVFEITGSEFTKSTHHTANGISVRFPRVTRRRQDKSPNEATKMGELQDLFDVSQASTLLSKKRKSMDDGEDAEAADEDEAQGRISLKSSPSTTTKTKKKQRLNEPDNVINDDGDESSIVSHGKGETQPFTSSSAIAMDMNGKGDKSFQLPENPSNPPLSSSAIVGILFYYNGRIVDPICGVGGGSIVLAHSVDNSGSWSNRGTMKQITDVFGQEASENYVLMPPNLGDMQLIKLKNKFDGGVSVEVYLCHLVAQQAQKSGGAPPFNINAFATAFRKMLQETVVEKNVKSVHLAKPHTSIPNLDWAQCESLLKKFSSEFGGVPIVVYTQDKGDIKKCLKADEILDKLKRISSITIATPYIAMSKHEFEERKPKSLLFDDPLNLYLLKENSVSSKIRDDLEEKNKKYQSTEISEEKSNRNEQTINNLSTKPTSSGNSNKIFEHNRVVIAGYSAEETDELKLLLQNHGGVVQDKWAIVGQQKSTHLICETFNEVFDHVEQLGGLVVNRNWIDSCLLQNKKLPEKDFIFPCTKEIVNDSKNDMKKTAMQHHDHGPERGLKSRVDHHQTILDDVVVVAPSPKKHQQVNDIKKETSSVGTTSESFAHGFNNCVFFFQPPIYKEKEMKKLIIHFDGDITTDVNEATHIISDEGPSAKIIAKESTSAKNVLSNDIWTVIQKLQKQKR